MNLIKKNLKKIKISLSLLTLSLPGLDAAAQSSPTCPLGTTPVTNPGNVVTCDPVLSDTGNLTGTFVPKDTTSLIAKITSIIKWIQYGLFIAATVLIVLAAYDYLFSKGDAEKIKTAQNTLIYAVIALVVGIIAGGLPKIVQGILGVS